MHQSCGVDIHRKACPVRKPSALTRQRARREVALPRQELRPLDHASASHHSITLACITHDAHHAHNAHDDIRRMPARSPLGRPPAMDTCSHLIGAHQSQRRGLTLPKAEAGGFLLHRDAPTRAGRTEALAGLTVSP